ncbi:YceD family protein [Methylotenera mobilis]|uniref:Large ribosomal RNA subunit accumulation protein YceD n=1 Tax=Methylotenera mobilis (strain JLW8 / ATCC BAA-1282 / DSM 17540) TaxID=583345 RepID=C6WVV5_METML|nr:YceD family protein [Methylotenera mobilis]ACT48054.1 protein of unknown function DUF177 [Methylotenera mobilis JLW8]
MTNQNILIDNLAFAARGERLQAKLPLTEFPRLCELTTSRQGKSTGDSKHTNTAEQAGEIEFTLSGEKNALGQSFLHLTLNANLITSCQRCLSEMPLTLALNFHYLISNADEESLEDLEAEIGDDIDIQEVSQAMDVKLLIEDEVILALPIAPVHESDCAPATTQSGEKPNPFAALKGLIKS